MKDQRKDVEVKVPKISKNLPVMKQSEVFDALLYVLVGITMIPLAYVARESVTLARSLTALASYSPHLEDYSLIGEDMLEFSSHAY